MAALNGLAELTLRLCFRQEANLQHHSRLQGRTKLRLTDVNPGCGAWLPLLAGTYAWLMYLCRKTQVSHAASITYQSS